MPLHQFPRLGDESIERPQTCLSTRILYVPDQSQEYNCSL